jgi:hypothetical protein
MTQINGRILTMYGSDFINQQQCCSIATDSPMTVFNVYREEFEYILVHKD